jgi:ribosome recycling factor
MASDVISVTETRMKKAVEALRTDLSSVRTGRAHPSLVANLTIDYYGTPTPLSQLANISAPEARLLVIQAWDQQAVNSISKAIQTSELHLNPAIEGNTLRIPIPALTEDRRKEMVKTVKQKVEQGRVAARNTRRDEVEKIRGMEKAKEMSQDESRRAQERIQKITDGAIAEMDILGGAKEVEVMEV